MVKKNEIYESNNELGEQLDLMCDEQEMMKSTYMLMIWWRKFSQTQQNIFFFHHCIFGTKI